MFVPFFEGVEYSYSFDCDTECFFLTKKNDLFSVVLKDDFALLFKKHLELLMTEPNDDIKERIEWLIELNYHFSTKPCPIPRFIET
jgi:plasmid replication initiation protein